MSSLASLPSIPSPCASPVRVPKPIIGLSEDDDEEANDSDDSNESDEDAEDQLAPMSSSPPPFEASRKRAMPRPARIPSPPWQMSGV
ncbi:hypothetical protein K525DRAFT_266933 [Schizophyllum commune Loenen D]|nr:hypothetical protein K525DRAFT_266933 [Schizophyllum commune Loenen D]